jgi:hypothetical protein
MLPYQSVPDPFISKAPISANGVGFYSRDEILTNVVNLLRAGVSISIVGERKAGKTSFLNYLRSQLPANEFIPVFIDTQFIAPQTDQIFLGWLLKRAAQAIFLGNNLNDLPPISTLTVEPEQVYITFQEELDQLRTHLQNKRLIWLVDEIETLRSYNDTNLFTFLRPLAQSDPDFRFVVAGYDVLYTLSNLSEWSPFFNAFSHIRLEGLNPVVAQQLIDDAVETMGAILDSTLYQPIFQWTGQKPYYLKWLLSHIATAINQRQADYQIDSQILQRAQTIFLDLPELNQHFNHLWSTHTTSRQQTVLSLIAGQTSPYNHLTILNDIKQNQLFPGDNQAKQHLIDDLTRLQQLGFLYERVGEYTFTSACLKTWIAKTKPLD